MTNFRATPAIHDFSAADAEARIDDLADILADAVAHGGSVNFMAGFSHDEAAMFWRGQISGLAAGTTRLLVADDGDRLIGTVLLLLAHQPNTSHRAEIGKMLVHSSARRRGIGRHLLNAAEDAPRAAGRTLLLLDTESGSGGDLLYRSVGCRPRSAPFRTTPTRPMGAWRKRPCFTRFWVRTGPPIRCPARDGVL